MLEQCSLVCHASLFHHTCNLVELGCFLGEMLHGVNHLGVAVLDMLNLNVLHIAIIV